MTRHIHADLMKAYAEDCSLVIESRLGGAWQAIGYPAWNPSCEYRIKPAPHPHAELMQLEKEKPETVFQYMSEYCKDWVDTVPSWAPHSKYRVKPPEPKKIKMWQWVYINSATGLPTLSHNFCESEEEAVKMIGKKSLQKAHWTEIEIEVSPEGVVL